MYMLECGTATQTSSITEYSSAAATDQSDTIIPTRHTAREHQLSMTDTVHMNDSCIIIVKRSKSKHKYGVGGVDH